LECHVLVVVEHTESVSVLVAVDNLCSFAVVKDKLSRSLS